MTPDFVIITPEISPGCGGVADHTIALLRNWQPLPNVKVLVANSGSVPPEWSSMVGPLGSTQDSILTQLPANGGRVFVQYSAYGFNRLGYPRDLIRALIEWKRRTAGRLVIMFHEIWTFWPVTNKNFIVQQFHRHAVKDLVRQCDVVFTTTPSQAEHLRHLSRSSSIHVLPVGSNIRRNETGAVTREAGSAALFGLQSNRIRALEMMRKGLSALAASGQLKHIVCLGHGSDPQASRREHELLAQLNLSGGFDQQGHLPEEALSEVLSSVSLGIFGQSELSCTKSGSFMAYAAHQLTVLSDFAASSKPPPVCWLVSPAELLNGIGRDELDRRAECLRMWQEQNCSWSVIADKMGGALGIQSAAGIT